MEGCNAKPPPVNSRLPRPSRNSGRTALAATLAPRTLMAVPVAQSWSSPPMAESLRTAAVAEGCPDGILLDVNLPGPDGFEVAALLAAACAEARIVLTSADLDQVPAEVMRACPAIAFVTKQKLAVADLETLFSG